MTQLLSQISYIAIFIALALYFGAWVFFALDLGRRSSLAGQPAQVQSAVERRAAREASGEASAAAGGRGITATLTRVSESLENEVTGDARGATRSQKIAYILTWTGLGVHLVSDVLRGIAADRVPWADMWEFSLTGTLIIVAIYLLASIRYDVRYLGTFVIGLVVVLLGIAITRYYVPVVPLPPALQSYWLIIHILVALLGTGFFATGFALAVVQLLQTRRERQEAESRPQDLLFLKTLPSSTTLENLTYRVNIVGFIFWTFTLIAGAIWADKAWGRYWGWDTKEVWTFIVWVIYAGYIHARATRGWRGVRSGWLSLIGFSAVMFNFGIVNVFFHGLHSYSGLSS